MDASKKSFFDSIRDSLHQIVSGDEKKELSGSEKQRRQAMQNDIEAAVIVLAAEVMRLGSNNSPETEKILADFLDRNLGRTDLPKRKKQIHDHLFVGPQPYTKMACEQLKSLATPESNMEIIRLLYELASADDFISSRENSLIQKTARYLDISAEELKAIKEKYVRANNPYAILEIEETMSVTEVKTAYRKMTLKYHPDKSAQVDRQEANRKFREIKKAYELILKKINP